MSTAAYAQDSYLKIYFGYIGSAFSELITSLQALNTSMKLSILAAFVFIVILFYVRTRDTTSNNIRKARDLHKKAVELHEKGEGGAAAEYYTKANEQREKAEVQL